MKHKLTVLACIGLALLLSTGFAFARNVGGLGAANGVQSLGVPRCATIQIPIYLNSTSQTGAWGLPLTITGGATFLAAAPGTSLAGCDPAFISMAGFPGTHGLLNFMCCLPAGNYPDVWNLTVQTPSTCTGFEIDTLFYPPAGAWVYVDCFGFPQPLDWVKGVYTLDNKPPVCGTTNNDETLNFKGNITNKQLSAIDPDPCDALTYSYVGAVPPLNASAQVTGDGKFSYTASCADKGMHVVTFRATDPCGASVDCTFKVTVTNTVPTCLTNADLSTYYQTPISNVQLNASDADGNPLTYSFVSMVPAGVNTPTVTGDGKFSWTPACGDVMNSPHTVTFRASDGCDQADCTFKVSVFQNPPQCQTPADQTYNWNAGPQNIALLATDDGCVNPITWSIVSVTPSPVKAATISGSNLVFDPECGDKNKTFTITVKASDGQYFCEETFHVSVINPNPSITCPGNITAFAGDLVGGTPTASDPYSDPLTFSYTFVHDSGGVPGGPVNAPTFNASTGAFSWQTASVGKDVGWWTVTLTVADGCGGSATCSYWIHVQSQALLCIVGQTGDTLSHVMSGNVDSVYVRLSSIFELGGVDLLICYDQTGLSFLNAEPAGALASSEWEYFTWRRSSNGNCGTGCPTGYVRIVAIADLDNGPHHPNNYVLSGPIVKLRFQVSADRTFINQCFNVGYCTLACGDNTLSSKDGKILYLPLDGGLCAVDTTKQHRNVLEFCTGKICVIPPPDDRGDINLNGVANEVGDAVLFTNYFIYGIDVFPPIHRDAQILASDVNADGTVLTVADLIYLIRIITGDAQPYPNGSGGYPKVSPYAGTATATYEMRDNALRVATTSTSDLGGALFVFRYSGMGVGEPTLSAAASSLKIKSTAKNGELRVLVYAWDKGAMVNAGTNELFTIPTTGEGTIELVGTEMSDASGAVLSATAAKVGLPTAYALLQNYPNPFNAGTVIRFNVVKETDWSLTVYNVAGQTVRTFSGRNGAGTISVPWDGTDNSGTQVASGVYFYRVNADSFTATKKMTLLK